MAFFPHFPSERAERLRRIRLARIAERVAKRVNTARAWRFAALAYDKAEGMAGLSVCNEVLRARVSRYLALAEMSA